MSLSPDPVPSSELVPETPSPPRQSKRRRIIVGLVFALLAFETGLSLIIFPWMENWEFNYFQNLFPPLENVWDDPYFRGAITGLGLVNIYIACLQIVHLIRNARRP